MLKVPNIKYFVIGNFCSTVTRIRRDDQRESSVNPRAHVAVKFVSGPGSNTVPGDCACQSFWSHACNLNDPPIVSNVCGRISIIVEVLGIGPFFIIARREHRK